MLNKVYKRVWGKWITLVLIALIAILLALYTFWHIMFDTSYGQAGDKMWVSIPQGSSTADIGALLQSHHVVASAFWFKIYVLLVDQKDLQAGTYRFSSGMTISQVVSLLHQGTAQFSTEVTVPEGFTVSQIAKLLAARHICSERAFYKLVQHGRFPYWFMNQLPHTKEIRYRLEGYLFPDTYEFVPDESPYDVVNTFLSETNRVLSHSIRRAIAKRHETLNQVLTVASMVEREVKVPSERRLVASVIYNRLRQHPPMKLQIDATVLYGLGRTTTDLTPADLRLQSPYNTYMHAGLPPGPIANPGLASILAAIYPAHTKYLYYVARFDGSGRQYFAVTYSQQLRNEARSQANLARLSK